MDCLVHIYGNGISVIGYLGRNFNYFLYPKYIVTTYLSLQLCLQMNQSKQLPRNFFHMISNHNDYQV